MYAYSPERCLPSRRPDCRIIVVIAVLVRTVVIVRTIVIVMVGLAVIILIMLSRGRKDEDVHGTRWPLSALGLGMKAFEGGERHLAQLFKTCYASLDLEL